MNERKPRFGEPVEANDKRLRILHIAGWYPSKKNPAAGVFVREHVKATALYNDVVVLYSEGVDKEIRSVYQIEDNIEDGIRTLRLRYGKSPIPKTSYFVYLWVMFRAFRKLLKEGFRPHVIHAHVYSAGVPAVLIGKRYRIPVVVTEHFSGFPLRLVRGVNKLMAKFAFEQANIVCPVSEDLKRHIEAYGIRAQFKVVPNVVDTSLFSPGNRDYAHREDNRKRLLLVALLGPIKGVPYLLEALALLKEKRDDFVLDVVGDGPNRSEYEELAHKLELRDVVHFHGLKTKQEVAEFMKRCDIFVLPSLFETFGAVLIEALACGKPVIASGIGGPNEIVTKEVGKLVPPCDPEVLAEAIDYMLDHYQEYDSKEIVRYVQSRYDYKAVGMELDLIYRQIAAFTRSCKDGAKNGNTARKEEGQIVEYRPFDYWQERLARDFSLGGVGMLGLGQIYNSWLYKLRVSAVNRAIRAMKIKVRGQSILDVGCGTGFWLMYWRRKGAAQLTGVDITDVAINHLRQIFPDIALYRDDIAGPEIKLPTTFDIISAFDVLFHITDDQGWSMALENIARHLKPGGWLLITDLFLHDKDFRGYHQASRRLAKYEAQLGTLGVRVLARFPIFVFAHPPLDVTGRWRSVLERVWSIQTTTLRFARRLGLEWLVAHTLGALIYFFDLIAIRLCQEGPTMELMVCRKEGDFCSHLEKVQR